MMVDLVCVQCAVVLIVCHEVMGVALAMLLDGGEVMVKYDGDG